MRAAYQWKTCDSARETVRASEPVRINDASDVSGLGVSAFWAAQARDLCADCGQRIPAARSFAHGLYRRHLDYDTAGLDRKSSRALRNLFPAHKRAVFCSASFDSST